MKNFHKFLLFAVIVSVDLFSQVTVKEKSDFDNGILFHLSFREVPYALEGENKNIINFFASMDESEANSPNLPSKTIFIAIPPESKIKVRLEEEKTHLINNVIPKLLPGLNFIRRKSLLLKDIPG